MMSCADCGHPLGSHFKRDGTDDLCPSCYTERIIERTQKIFDRRTKKVDRQHGRMV